MAHLTHGHPERRHPLNMCWWLEWDLMETQELSGLPLSLGQKTYQAPSCRKGTGQDWEQHNFPPSWTESSSACTVVPKLSGILQRPENCTLHWNFCTLADYFFLPHLLLCCNFFHHKSSMSTSSHSFISITAKRNCQITNIILCFNLFNL